MTAEQLRKTALSMPGAEERETWGHPTFRVRGKIFVGMDGDGSTARVKASGDEQAALIATDPETFAVAPRVGRFGWVEVQLGEVDADVMRELVIEAWRRSAPKSLVAEIAGE